MSATSGEKSQGMKFAEEQMHKHGWKEGKGLGRRENGISEAVKVKVKCDNSGEGVKVNRLKDEEAPLTNKKPRKALCNKNMLYGRFVKSATLLSGGEQSVNEPSSPESSDSSGDEDEKLDLSSANKLTDEQLNKVCGGRTAHKGARHGLTMSAKLSRLEEQEREFLAKYGKKEQKDKGKVGTLERTDGLPGKNIQPKDSKECTETNISHEPSQHKKKKKRKRVNSERKEKGESQENCHEEEQVPPSEQEVKLTKKKNKKKHGEESPSPQEEQTGESTKDFCIKPKKKKKNKTRIDLKET